MAHAAQSSVQPAILACACPTVITIIMFLPLVPPQLQAQHEAEMEANRGVLLHADLQPVDSLVRWTAW
jgi:hypothetical protein